METVDLVLAEIRAERRAQDAKWGVQNWPDGTGTDMKGLADKAKAATDATIADKSCTWTHILTEEFFEALAEEDPVKLRVELIQTAAVATAWVEAIDRRDT